MFLNSGGERPLPASSTTLSPEPPDPSSNHYSYSNHSYFFSILGFHRGLNAPRL